LVQEAILGFWQKHFHTLAEAIVVVWRD